MSPTVSLDPDAACDACGKFGAFTFDGRTLCGDCYESSGSCGPDSTGLEPDSPAKAADK
ncbi:MAG: hypothetical protein HY301_17085 [Verrucomicrobia bacterium]|nr:hypothetical protein [Verrucomicrobiota bacterium]